MSISLPPSFVDWKYYSDPSTCHLFIHLLFSAKPRDVDYMDTTIHRGQLLTSRKELRESTGLTDQQIRTAMRKLWGIGEAFVEHFRSKTLITIRNYDSYVEHQPRGNQEVTKHQPENVNISEELIKNGQNKGRSNGAFENHFESISSVSDCEASTYSSDQPRGNQEVTKQKEDSERNGENADNGSVGGDGESIVNTYVKAYGTTSCSNGSDDGAVGKTLLGNSAMESWRTKEKKEEFPPAPPIEENIKKNTRTIAQAHTCVRTSVGVRAYTGERACDKPDTEPDGGTVAGQPKKQARRKAQFSKPTVEEIIQYAKEHNYETCEADAFFDHFESNGWLVSGKTPMRDWRAAYRNWLRSPYRSQKGYNNSVESADKSTDMQKQYDSFLSSCEKRIPARYEEIKRGGVVLYMQMVQTCKGKISPYFGTFCDMLNSKGDVDLLEAIRSAYLSSMGTKGGML